MIEDKKPKLAFTTACTPPTIVLYSLNTFIPRISSVIASSFVPRFLVLLVATDTDVPFVRHQRWVPIAVVEGSVADSAAADGR
jgi:hypothetical protein